jgi:hypothetical protein
MIIVDNTQSTQRFSYIRNGAVFKKECEGAKPDYCMKIHKILDQPSQEQYNAVNLEDGSLQFFAEYEEVVPYEATVQLEL